MGYYTHHQQALRWLLFAAVNEGRIALASTGYAASRYVISPDLPHIWYLVAGPVARA
jgi:hypothetical protein